MLNPPSLRDYQIADLAFLIANRRALYLNEPATGKTPTVCVLMQYCWADEAMGTAWAMPKSLLEKNYYELLRFTDFTAADVCILDGTAAQIESKLRSGAKVFLMGYRRFTLSWRDLPAHVQFLCGDEVHLKGWGGASSANTAAMWEAMRTRFKRYVAMTGTLVSGRLDSAYPSIHAIEPRYYPNHEAFYNYHAYLDWDGNLIGWQNQDKLSKILGRHGIRRTFASVYGAEEKVIQTELCHMSEPHRKMFEELKEQAYLELEKFIVDGTLPGVGFIRARQIQEHPNLFPDLTAPGSGRFVDALPGVLPNKMERLAIHFEDHRRTGKPLILFSALVPQQHQIKQLADACGLNLKVLNGQVAPKVRSEIDREYREGRIQGLIGTPEVASVGYNWDRCGDQWLEHMIFVAMDYMDTSFLQAYRRGIRGKRPTPLLVRVMEYDDSIDQRVFDIIHRKSHEANKVDPTREVFNLSAYNRKEARAA